MGSGEKSSSIPKLKGSENYIVWSLRVEAYLTKLKLVKGITEENYAKSVDALAEIRLLLEDGPLLQVKHLTTAKQAWDFLKNHFNSSGFTSDFLLLRELLEGSYLALPMEDYLNKLKEITDELSAREISLPEPFIIAFLLHNLGEEYSNYTTSVIQALRSNPKSYNFESLSASLLDESKRLETTKDIIGHLRTKKPWKKNKRALKCSYCKLPGHLDKDCYFLHPNKAPKGFSNHRVSKPSSKSVEKPNNKREQREEKQEQLLVSLANRKASSEAKEINSEAESEPEDLMDIEIPPIITQALEEVNWVNNLNNLYKNSYNNLSLGPIEEEIPRILEISRRYQKVKTLYKYTKDITDFIYDTGATKHIVSNRSLFISYYSINKTVSWGQASSLIVKGCGDIKFHFKNNNKIYILRNCYYIPELGVNLISHSSFSNEISTYLDNKNVYLFKKGEIITKGSKRNNLYILSLNIISENKEIYHTTLPINNISLTKDKSINKTIIIDIYKWHLRLAHLNIKTLRRYLLRLYKEKFPQENISFKIPQDQIIQIIQCENCIQAKATEKIKKVINKTTYTYLDKVVTDICGPIKPISFDKKKYIITFLDKGTKSLKIYSIRNKSEALDKFKEYKAEVENNKDNITIKEVFSDNAKEYRHNLASFCKKKGIIYNFSPPYTKEPNGAAERINRTILNKIRTIIFTSNIPRFLWPEAANAIEYIYNRTPHSSIGFKCPLELKENRILTLEELDSIKIFGSIIYYKNKLPRDKLDIRAYKGVIIGYSDNSYKIWDYKKRKIIISRDVIIHENTFFNNYSTINIEEEVINNDKNSSLTEPELDIATKLVVHIPKKPIDYYKDFQEIPSIIALLNENHIEPSSYYKALESIDKDKWNSSMKIEVEELLAQKVWSIKDLPNNRKPIKGRWVYKIKTNSDNSNIRYKSRWVVQGYNQIQGLDYTETFATTSRPETIKLLLIIAVANNYKILQYDVKNAFVHSEIDEEIYTIPPIGFKDDILKSLETTITKELYKEYKENKKELVLKLNKALYGLKQSPRLWYNFLSMHLNKLGFKPIPYDEGVFINNIYKIAIICHVDDQVFIGPNESDIKNIINLLTKDIKMQSLGEIKDFLGMNITIDRENKGLYINQIKYINNKIKEYNKQDIGTSEVPSIAGSKLQKATINPSKEDILQFQKEIGSLLYPSIKTRPDLAYAVNCVSRFSSKPDNSHFKALDLIWKYLNKYKDLGLYYNCNFQPNSLNNIIRGYSDSDWASDITDRKSISGYCFFLYNNLISWNTTKQKSVALSTCEAEYMALKETAKESLSLNSLYRYINKNLSLTYNRTIPPILTDNEAAKQLAENSSFYKRSKHIDISYHFIRDEIKEGKINLYSIRSKDNIADFFTKGLNPLDYKRLREFLSLYNYKAANN